MLGTPERIRFLADFCPWLAERKAGSLGDLDESLRLGLADRSLPDFHAREAMELVESEWARREARSFLEACLNRRHDYPAPAQSALKFAAASR